MATLTDDGLSLGDAAPTADASEAAGPSAPEGGGGDGLETRLREARRAIGLTQRQVAERLGVSRRAVSEWETGLRAPHLHLPALEALYGVSATFLLYGVEPASVELQALRDEVAQVQSDLVSLAEAVELGFRKIVALLEQRERVEAPDDAGS